MEWGKGEMNRMNEVDGMDGMDGMDGVDGVMGNGGISCSARPASRRWTATRTVSLTREKCCRIFPYWKGLFCLCGLIGGLLFCACRSVEVSEGDRQRTESVRLGETILEAVRDKDSEKFLSQLPPQFRNRKAEQDFLRSREDFLRSFGEIRDFRLIAEPETPEALCFVWLVRVVRRSGNGPVVERDLLFRLLTLPSESGVGVLSYSFL